MEYEHIYLHIWSPVCAQSPDQAWQVPAALALLTKWPWPRNNENTKQGRRI